jgi:hypothetical protein
MKAKQQLTIAIDTIKQIREMIYDLPCGVDEEADWEDDSPEDTTAHLGGLMIQVIDAALGQIESP